MSKRSDQRGNYRFAARQQKSARAQRELSRILDGGVRHVLLVERRGEV